MFLQEIGGLFLASLQRMMVSADSDRSKDMA